MNTPCTFALIWYLLSSYMPMLVILGFPIFCIVHLIRNGRSFGWLWIILLFPLLGSIIYIIVEVVGKPGTTGMAGRGQGVFSSWQRNRKITQLRKDLAMGDTLATRIRLADELLIGRRYREVVETLGESYRGIGKNDIQVQWILARALVELPDYAAALGVIDSIDVKKIKLNEGEHLLLKARCLEETASFDEADAVYAQAVKIFTGEEARYRYGMFLKRNDQSTKAGALFGEIIDRSQVNPPFYVKRNKKWIKLAKRNR